MTYRLPIAPDKRTGEERRAALDAARDGEQARELLAQAIAGLDRALIQARTSPVPEAMWDELDAAYDRLSDYLRHLTRSAELRISCTARCSACCVNIPAAFAIESARVVRSLKQQTGAQPRLQRAVEYARKFQSILLEEAAGDTSTAGRTESEPYKRAHARWALEGMPCPALGDDGNCGAYEARPITCRAHVSIEDPSFCEPGHPKFAETERVHVWGPYGDEQKVYERLLALGATLGLPSTPNLHWGLAALHGHPLTR